MIGKESEYCEKCRSENCFCDSKKAVEEKAFSLMLKLLMEEEEQLRRGKEEMKCRVEYYKGEDFFYSCNELYDKTGLNQYDTQNKLTELKRQGITRCPYCNKLLAPLASDAFIWRVYRFVRGIFAGSGGSI